MNRHIVYRFLSIVLVLAILAGVVAPVVLAANEPMPPGQPASGPGGSDYVHQQVVSAKYGSGETAYYLYEPANPTPDSAPVVVLAHGLGAINPATYLAWIEHIVKKGNIVIFPVYQSLLTPPGEYTKNAGIGVRDALLELQNGQHVEPELDKFALTGHSCGGMIAADLAAAAVEHGLPTPDVVMPVQPGCIFRWGDLSQIPSSALLLVFVGEDDTVVGDFFAKRIWYQTLQIPLAQKDYIIQRTDNYGSPDLLADHNSPLAFAGGGAVDAMDWFGNWKLFDALTDCAWYGVNCNYALGGGLRQIWMGRWSDGRPVKRLVQTKEP